MMLPPAMDATDVEGEVLTVDDLGVELAQPES